MITAERAIADLRRDLTLGRVLKVASGVGVATAIVLASAAGAGTGGLLLAMAFVVGSGWVSARLTRRSAVVADSPGLIAAGQFDEAEQRIEQVLGTFWTLRSAKLLGLHHLAALRHAQRRWRESALLSRALLRQRLTGLPGLARTARLMLADSSMELGDLPAAHDALGGLYADRLSLDEATNLLVIQLEYEAAVGAWAAMLANVGQKVQLAELLPAASAARAQALLALAAGRQGRADLADWLRRRAALLADPAETRGPAARTAGGGSPARRRMRPARRARRGKDLSWRTHLDQGDGRDRNGRGGGADDRLPVDVAARPQLGGRRRPPRRGRVGRPLGGRRRGGLGPDGPAGRRRGQPVPRPPARAGCSKW